MTDKMIQQVMTEPGRIEFREVDIPETQADQVLVTKIILSNLGRTLRINFPTTCREYKTHFQPNWSEV